MVKKILESKLFENWKTNIKQLGYEILVLSQFTLFATFKGKKPNFNRAEEHERAKELFTKTIELFKTEYEAEKIKNGIFGEVLDIMLVNDGPVTIIYEK